MLKVIWWGLLGGQLGKRGDLKGVRIGSVNEKRNSLASERDYIKRTEQYQVLRGMGNLTREIRSWSGYTNW